MRPLRQLATGLALCAVLSSPAWAQGNQSPQTPTTDSETRPATTSVYGDTGLWYVPTGEVLPRGRWSVSGYRTNWDREESATDISNFRVTFGYGATDRVELFGCEPVAERRHVGQRVDGLRILDPGTDGGQILWCAVLDPGARQFGSVLAAIAVDDVAADAVACPDGGCHFSVCRIARIRLA